MHQWYDDYAITGFCLTFVADVPPQRVGEVLRSVAGATQETSDDVPAAASVYRAEGGTLLLERDGYAATFRNVANALSAGTRVAIVLKPFTGQPKFAFVRDTEVVCAFLLDDPMQRWGTAPDELLAELTAMGLDLPVEDDWDEDEDEEVGGDHARDRILAVVSLAERATGVGFDLTGSDPLRLSTEEFHEVSTGAARVF